MWRKEVSPFIGDSGRLLAVPSFTTQVQKNNLLLFLPVFSLVVLPVLHGSPPYLVLASVWDFQTYPEFISPLSDLMCVPEPNQFVKGEQGRGS